MLDKQQAHEQRVAAERAWAADLAKQRRWHWFRLAVLATLGVAGVVVGAIVGGVAFAGGLVFLGVVVAVCVLTGSPPNRPGEQAPVTPEVVAGPGHFTP